MVTEWSYEDEWFEETNVAREIRDYLHSTGCEIVKFNEDKMQRGPDIEAIKDEQKLIIEVKGYPSDKYVRGPDKGKKKRTPTNLQAKHWFGEALLSLLIAKSNNPSCKIAIGLPKFRVYEELLEKVNFVIEKIEIGFLLVDKEKNVLRNF